MSLSSSAQYSSLYSAPIFPRTIQIQSKFVNPTTSRLFSIRNNHPFLSSSCNFLSKPFLYVVKASSSEIESSQISKQESEEEPYEEYEVEIVQPYGLKFVKGRDGGTYIDAIAPGGNADKTGKFTVGDKVLATRLNLKSN